jgi:membrane protease YdiL (CAAX protease family)
MLDVLFASYLLVLMPGWQLWRSLKKKDAGEPEPIAGLTGERFFRNLRFIIAPLVALTVVMALSGRRLADLGLDMPVSLAGRWGLLAVVVLMLLPIAWSVIAERKSDQAKKDKEFAQLEALGGVPKSAREMWANVVLFVLLGTGWELLYRGYLMLVLTPVTGLPVAVILSALAYGIGHGYKNPRQFIGSIVSAFLFTLGYVFTGSLWWLMLLHVCLPLYGTLSGYLMLRKREAKAAVAA